MAAEPRPIARRKKPQKRGKTQAITPPDAPRAVDVTARGRDPEGSPDAAPPARVPPDPIAALFARVSPRMAAWITALVGLVVYVRTLAPSVTSEDSGELITAVAKWGSPHPPGYPLYCLVAKPFLLIPIGNIAYRINLASAVFGAATGAVVVLLATEIGASVFGALIAGSALLVARSFWSQAVVAEVYPLNALLLAIGLLLAVRGTKIARAERTPEQAIRTRRYAGAIGLVAGLGLSHHHPLMWLAAPSVLWFLARRGHPLFPDRRHLSLAGLGLLMGLAVYVYLPLAARGHPPINWGDPSTLARFWAHVTRSAYQHVEQSAPFRWSDKASYAWLFVTLLASQWTWPLLVVFGGAGAWTLRDRRPERDLLLGVALVTVVGLVLVPSYPFEQENIQRFDELYLPVYVALSPMLACGVTALVARAGLRDMRLGLVAHIAAASLFFVPCIVHWEENDLSRHDLTDKYNRYALASLEPNALYFPSGDYTSFPALYLQAVEGVRPDVLLANATGELTEQAISYGRALAPNEAGPIDRATLQSRALALGDRPLYVASKSDLAVSARTAPWGLVYRVFLPERSPMRAPPDLLAKPPLGERPEIPAADDLARALVSDYHLMRGEALFEQGSRTDALAEYLRAASLQPASKEAVNNVASTCAERGFTSEAEALMKQAASLSPTYATPRRNLARMYESMGRHDDAIRAFEDLVRAAPEDLAAAEHLRALQQARNDPAAKPEDPRIGLLKEAISKDPNNPALHNNLGNVYAESRDAARAKAAYEAALRVDPTYALAHKNLAVLYRDVLRDPVRSEAHMEQYRALGGK